MDREQHGEHTRFLGAMFFCRLPEHEGDSNHSMHCLSEVSGVNESNKSICVYSLMARILGICELTKTIHSPRKNLQNTEYVVVVPGLLTAHASLPTQMICAHM
jgi:hypothetical protein